ncbi:putative transcriptional regulator [Staphylococcus schweitzeri]|nr:putative transcriptional regulator [Staphylococcus schweitzeri]CDR55035.1 putative transcriptional regulator [Staphylococcus schweitzeri]CDR61980.1 putative transcriptional regulator [Staphylococcus schweitzeri]VEE66655.1 HTH-type transcriptional activator hxlR [Staphylococcus schweitzeri]
MSSNEYEDFNHALSIMNGKWKMQIIFTLGKEGTLRYGEIKRRIKNITHKMLSKQLKELKSEGLILREEYPQIPPKVEYSLSKKGEALLPVCKYLCDWSKRFK